MLIGLIRYLLRQLGLTESVKDATKSGLPVTIREKTKVSKVRKIIQSDGRCIARAVGISLSRVHFILKRSLQVRKISATYIFIFPFNFNLLKNSYFTVIFYFKNRDTLFIMFAIFQALMFNLDFIIGYS